MRTTKISVLDLLLMDGLPKRKVFVKIAKVNLDIWRSILFRFLMRLHHSLRQKGKMEKKLSVRFGAYATITESV